MFDAIETAVRARQPIYPPEQSAGGINTFTVKGCKVVGHTPGYCVCLNKIKAYERDKALTSYPECERAISGKVCPALDMRREEQVAGQALYFIDRALLREEMDKAFASSSARFAPTKTVVTTKPTRAAPTTLKDTTEGIHPTASVFEPENGYAAAINAAIKEAATQPAEPIPEPKVVSPSPSPVKQGLSMVERTRLQMGLSKE
jgi:hypothetical protein